MTYIVKSSKKLQLTHGGTISNSVNGQMVYIYSSYVMHVFEIFYHMVVILITLIYMLLMMFPCTLVSCMWCGDEYKNRVVFLICDRFSYTYYYVDWSPTDVTNLYHAPRNSTFQFTNYDTRSVYIKLCARFNCPELTCAWWLSTDQNQFLLPLTRTVKTCHLPSILNIVISNRNTFHKTGLVYVIMMALSS